MAERASQEVVSHQDEAHKHSRDDACLVSSHEVEEGHDDVGARKVGSGLKRAVDQGAGCNWSTDPDSDQ